MCIELPCSSSDRVPTNLQKTKRNLFWNLRFLSLVSGRFFLHYIRWVLNFKLFSIRVKFFVKHFLSLFNGDKRFCFGCHCRLCYIILIVLTCTYVHHNKQWSTLAFVWFRLWVVCGGDRKNVCIVRITVLTNHFILFFLQQNKTTKKRITPAKLVWEASIVINTSPVQNAITSKRKR